MHWAKSVYDSDEDFIAQCQQATMDWGLLAQATGGSLKPSKCYIYFMIYKFVRGRAKLKLLRDLPTASSTLTLDSGKEAPAHIVILQPDSSSCPIQTLDVSEASKMLGIHFVLKGDSTTHIEDRILAKPLHRHNAWLSFFMQLYPGMLWGLVSVVLSPLKLNEMMQKLYYKILPILGINCCITKAWRMLPEIYQGLGLLNFVVIAFAAKVYFLQSHWGFEGATSDAMQFAYEAFLVEIGLYGNVFSHAFEKYKILATNGTWFKNFWELGDHLGITLDLRKDFHLQPVRQNDRAIMEVLSTDGGFTGSTLEALNVVRLDQNLVHMSDLVHCDGKTID